MQSSTFAYTRRPTTLSYLAGLMEGEGSFLCPPPSGRGALAIALAMTDNDVVARAALLAEANHHSLQRRQPHHKDVHVLRVRGRRAAELMQALYAEMGARRRAQIDGALAHQLSSSRRVPYVGEILEIATLKEGGASRSDLARRYGVGPKSIDRLMRGDDRSLDDIRTLAEQVRDVETALADAVGNDTDMAWLAGLLEGEGSFSPTVRIGLTMTDRDVVERAAALLGSPVHYEPPRQARWMPTWHTGVRRATVVLEICERIQAAMGERRRMQIDAMRLAITSRKPGRANPRAPRPASRRSPVIPAERLARNIEIARRLRAGESGPRLASEYGMTHQNVYYIAHKYEHMAACPSG